MWRDAHMLCLASNLGKWRTASLGLPVWRYRFDLVANNLNSAGANIGTFHGMPSCVLIKRTFQGRADRTLQARIYASSWGMYAIVLLEAEAEVALELQQTSPRTRHISLSRLSNKRFRITW